MRRSTMSIVLRYGVVSALAVCLVASGLYVAGRGPDDASATTAYAEKANVGRLKVKVKPKKARQDGGQWTVDAGVNWYNHKQQIFLDPGDYTVEFKDINGWVAPNDKNVTIELLKRTKAKGKYMKQM